MSSHDRPELSRDERAFVEALARAYRTDPPSPARARMFHNKLRARLAEKAERRWRMAVPALAAAAAALVAVVALPPSLRLIPLEPDAAPASGIDPNPGTAGIGQRGAESESASNAFAALILEHAWRDDTDESGSDLPPDYLVLAGLFDESGTNLDELDGGS